MKPSSSARAAGFLNGERAEGCDEREGQRAEAHDTDARERVAGTDLAREPLGVEREGAGLPRDEDEEPQARERDAEAKT